MREMVRKEVTHEVEDRGALSASVHGVTGVRHCPDPVADDALVTWLIIH